MLLHPLQLIKEAKLWRILPKKSLGQNFLIDPLVVEFVVDQFSPHDTVLEIGPGLGIVTFPLAEKVKELWSVEKDQRMVGFLRQEGQRLKVKGESLIDDKKKNFNLQPSTFNLKLIPGDYLKVSRDVKTNIPKPYKIFGNIPYYITNPIIQDIIQTPQNITPIEAILMVQKEVAERVVGKKGSVGLLTILVELACYAEFLANVPKNSFTPQPKVDSALVKFSFGKGCGKKDILTKVGIEEKQFLGLVKHCFLGRRKKIRNTLATYLHKDPSEIETRLSNIAIDFNKRPEELQFEEWVEIAKSLIVP